MVLVIMCAKVGPSARRLASAIASASSASGATSRLKKPQRSPSSADMVRPVKSSSAARPWPIDARQHGAGAHVAAGEADAREEERGLGRRRAEAHVGEERDHRAGADADAVDRGDDRLRRTRFMAFTRSPVMRVKASRPFMSRVEQRADDVVHVAAGAEVAAVGGDAPPP